MPWSQTVNATDPLSSRTQISIAPPPGEYLMAFVIRFSTTRPSRSVSPLTTSGAASIASAIGCRSEARSNILTMGSTTVRRSTGCKSNDSECCSMDFGKEQTEVDRIADTGNCGTTNRLSEQQVVSDATGNRGSDSRTAASNDRQPDDKDDH